VNSGRRRGSGQDAVQHAAVLVVLVGGGPGGLGRTVLDPDGVEADVRRHLANGGRDLAPVDDELAQTAQHQVTLSQQSTSNAVVTTTIEHRSTTIR